MGKKRSLDFASPDEEASRKEWQLLRDASTRAYRKGAGVGMRRWAAIKVQSWWGCVMWCVVGILKELSQSRYRVQFQIYFQNKLWNFKCFCYMIILLTGYCLSKKYFLTSVVFLMHVLTIIFNKILLTINKSILDSLLKIFIYTFYLKDKLWMCVFI